MSFIKELYIAHIEAFSQGLFIEPGNPNKVTIDDYLDTFNNLIDTIKKNGFDLQKSIVPVGKNNIILDGAHRTAIAIYFNIKLPIVRFENLEVNFNSNFFKQRLLLDKYVDYLVYEFCKFKNNTYIACLWPRGENISLREEAKKIILNHDVKIVYEKNIELSYTGLTNLMIQAYSNQKWIGNIDNKYKGIYKKVDACYAKKSPLKILILEGDSFEEILKIKSEIRDLFNIENHCIHITDNKIETLQLSGPLLNENSIKFLNSKKELKYLEFEKRILQFRNYIYENKYDIEDFLIDSSSTLGVYGIREPQDIDFISLQSNTKLPENDIWNDHQNHIKYYNKSVEELILNPDNYFFYNDLKFITLSNLKVFKKNRNEEKDKLDLKLINNINEISFKSKCNNMKYKFLISYRNFKTRLKNILKIILSKIGIYQIILPFYRKLKELLK